MLIIFDLSGELVSVLQIQSDYLCHQMFKTNTALICGQISQHKRLSDTKAHGSQIAEES